MTGFIPIVIRGRDGGVRRMSSYTHTAQAWLMSPELASDPVKAAEKQYDAWHDLLRRSHYRDTARGHPQLAPAGSGLIVLDLRPHPGVLYYAGLSQRPGRLRLALADPEAAAEGVHRHLEPRAILDSLDGSCCLALLRTGRLLQCRALDNAGGTDGMIHMIRRQPGDDATVPMTAMLTAVMAEAPAAVTLRCDYRLRELTLAAYCDDDPAQWRAFHDALLYAGFHFLPDERRKWQGWIHLMSSIARARGQLERYAESRALPVSGPSRTRPFPRH